jgi:hypothetical protein
LQHLVLLLLLLLRVLLAPPFVQACGVGGCLTHVDFATAAALPGMHHGKRCPMRRTVRNVTTAAAAGAVGAAILRRHVL